MNIIENSIWAGATFEHISDVDDNDQDQLPLNIISNTDKSSSESSERTITSPSIEPLEISANKENIDDEKVAEAKIKEPAEVHDNRLQQPVSINYTNISRYCLILSLAGFPIGWDIATSSSVISNQYFPVRITSSFKFGTIISSFHLGCVFGSLYLGTKLVNLKNLLQLGVLIYGFGSMLQIFGLYCVQLWLFIVGRVVIGIGVGTLGVVGPMYMQELIVGGNKAGFYLSFFQIIATSTILLGNLINYALNKWFYYIYLIEFIKLWYMCTFLGLIYFLPSSIRYFRIMNMYDELLEVFNKLINNLNDSVFERIIHSPIKANHNVDYKLTIIGCLIMMFQQFTGINYFFYYGNIIFESEEAILVLCGVNLFATFVALWFIKLLKLKHILITSSFLMSVILIVYSNIGQFANHTLPLLMLTTLFVIVFAASWGPGAGVLVNLISQNNSNVVSAAIAASWLANCLVTMITPWMIQNTGFLYGYFFSIMLVILGIFIYYFIE